MGGFAIALVASQGSLDAAWDWIRDLPLVAQVMVWVAFLPVVAGLWVWSDSAAVAILGSPAHPPALGG